MKPIQKILSIIVLGSILAGCRPAPRGDHEIKIGAIAGPESALLEVAKNVAQAQYGLKLTIVEFEDYVLPNTALADGSIDANMFQHLPYLEATLRSRHYPIQSIGRTFVFPMGLYSKKIKSLHDLPEGLKVAIPNDPSNGARALLLLQSAGLIKLDTQDNQAIALSHIEANPHHFVFVELDAAQLPRTLDDVDLAAINTNYAIPFGLYPSKTALFKESSDSPYANIVVIRSADKDKAKFKALLSAIQSPEVLEKAQQLFEDEAIKSW